MSYVVVLLCHTVVVPGISRLSLGRQHLIVELDALVKGSDPVAAQNLQGTPVHKLVGHEVGKQAGPVGVLEEMSTVLLYALLDGLFCSHKS